MDYRYGRARRAADARRRGGSAAMYTSPRRCLGRRDRRPRDRYYVHAYPTHRRVTTTISTPCGSRVLHARRAQPPPTRPPLWRRKFRPVRCGSGGGDGTVSLAPSMVVYQYFTQKLLRHGLLPCRVVPTAAVCVVHLRTQMNRPG